MADETLRVRLLISGIDFTDDPVTDKTTADAAVWKPQPLTLRDDELVIAEAEPEEEEINSHENDAAEDYSITGGSVQATGSFIKATVEQLVGLLGGKKDGTTYMKPAKKLLVEKAIRFRFKEGGWVVLPKAKGYVIFNLNPGRGGRVKFPFKFTALAPSNSEYDLIWETVAVPAAPAVAPMSVPTTETKK